MQTQANTAQPATPATAPATGTPTTSAQAYDCGDGVPDLALHTNGPITEQTAIVEATTDQPPITPQLAFMFLTVIGQLLILAAVLAGGNALVGAAAGLAVLACALTVLGARTLREVLFGR